MIENIFKSLTTLTNARTKRESSWDKTGRNSDFWRVKPGEKKVLADIKGAGCITHIWMTQGFKRVSNHFRKVLLKMYWDNEKNPSGCSAFSVNDYGITFTDNKITW